MNPYITQLFQKREFIPVNLDKKHEEVAEKEGFAVLRANGYRLRSKSRHKSDVKQVA